MKTNIPDNCGNSPRSMQAVEVAISLAASQYAKLEPILAEDFTWHIVGEDRVLTRSGLKGHMDKNRKSEVSTRQFDVLTSISHGKYASVSSRTHLSDGSKWDSHDLYEFTSAGGSAKLRKITSYRVDSKR